MHEGVKQCLKGKRTELLKEMLVEARVPSPDFVVELLRHGAPPFGELPASGAFEPLHHGATKSFKQALQAGKWSKAVPRSTVRPSRDARLDQKSRTGRTRKYEKAKHKARSTRWTASWASAGRHAGEWASGRGRHSPHRRLL